MPLPQYKDRYTYRDYCAWPEEERWEIIDGVAYDMSPAPDLNHQAVSFRLSGFFLNALRGKPCVGFAAPTDVVLSDRDVVQPDLLVVCDKTKLKDKHVQGAPDLIVEILSPATAKIDRREKHHLYEKFGVKEYVLIDPNAQFAEQYVLGTNSRYGRGEIFDVQQVLPLKSLDGLPIPLWEMFGVEKK